MQQVLCACGNASLEVLLAVPFLSALALQHFALLLLLQTAIARMPAPGCSGIPHLCLNAVSTEQKQRAARA